ncbi:MAG: methyltransferase domain-containing protein [Solirubrobacterales bacterium]
MSGPEVFRVSAGAYDKLMGRYGPQLGRSLIDFAGVQPGMRVLDVGCGPGALTGELANYLGARNVSAVDPSESFVDACRKRHPAVEVAAASAEALPFDGNTFDATLSQLVVNFMTDAETGVREMCRVTRPGGVVSSCVWDDAGEMTLLRAFWRAARDIDPERAAAVDESAGMRLCEEGALARLWRAAGLRDIRAGALTVRATYNDFDDLWSPFPEGVGPSGAFCRSLGENKRAELYDALRGEIDVGDGQFELTARAWVVSGSLHG